MVIKTDLRPIFEWVTGQRSYKKHAETEGEYLIGLNGWMTKTPLCSCRIHSFSTAISLPYTYRDCLFSCGRSRARHPQVAVVYPAVGPLGFSMAMVVALDQPKLLSILTRLLRLLRLLWLLRLLRLRSQSEV